MTFRDPQGRLRSIPSSWTDVAAPDPFVAVAAGRAHFRLCDLIALADLVRRLSE